MNFLTELKEGAGISWAAIRANKMRSSLTTLGIVIGIVTVTLMGTAIEGLNGAFLRSISTLGTDVLYVHRFGWFNDSFEDWMRARKRRPIDLDQVRALTRQMTLARAIAPVADDNEQVKYKNRSASSVRIIGTTEQFLQTGGLSVAAGRFMSGAEVDGSRPICVIGFEVATNLFQLESPLGNKIRIGPCSFEVVGVLDKQGSFLGAFSLDNQVVIPASQFMTWFWQRPDWEIQIKAVSQDQLEDAKAELQGLMRKIRHVAPGKPDDFSIDQQDMFIQTFNKVVGTIEMGGLCITGLSLFVGGIGIMNIMFVSVAERTREIGVRKAIGAKRRTILVQFLIEAASICLLGGLVGLAIAYPLTLLVNRFLPATMSLKILGVSLLVSALTGVVSGFMPAWRAARMNPVDALRNE
jgi:putative ABC transport system permease protein